MKDFQLYEKHLKPSKKKDLDEEIPVKKGGNKIFDIKNFL